MKNKSAINGDTQQNIITGRTEVIVKRRDINEGREIVRVIHEGTVIQQTTGGFLRVYKPTSKGGGDTAQEHAEFFPRDSKLCWCEVSNVRDEWNKIEISPVLR